MNNKVHTGFPTPKKNYYKVYVNSNTYNQAPYIEDCLNGVAMQQTDFPFVHHVIDDCSTDGEQEVIKAYLNNNCDMENAEYYDNDICSITIAKNKSNPNCTLAVYFLKKNMYGNPERIKLYKSWQDVCPYEALCEGDDYWINSQKLHIQVEVMDADDSCTLCYHSCKNIWDKEDFITYKGSIGDDVKCTYNIVDILSGYPFQTATVLIRTSIYRSPLYNKIKGKNFTSSFLFLIAAELGHLSGINKQMSVYRRNASGVSNSDRLPVFVMYCKKLICNGRFFSRQTYIKIHKIAVRRYICYISNESMLTSLRVLCYEIIKEPVLGIVNFIYLLKNLAIKIFRA